MATSLGRRSPQGGDQEPPDWSPVTEPPPTKARQTLEIVVRGLIAVGVAALLWALGRPHFAIVLVVVATALTAASLLWPGFAAGVDRAVSALQRWAGRVLALVLVGGLQVLVFTPLWLILRLVRHDPLALGAGPRTRRSGGRPRARPAALYRRPFAYERLPRVVRGGDRCRCPRLRAALGLVALLLLLDVGIGAAIDALEGPGGGESAKTNSGLRARDVPAGRGEPGACTLGTRSTRSGTPSAMTHTSAGRCPTSTGRYVNVEHGVRRSYEPPAGGSGRPRQVYFFGGSAMFGLFQRDEHTIPSEFARLAAARRHPRASRQLRAAGLRQLAGDAELQQLVTQGHARTWRCSTTASTSSSASSPRPPLASPRTSRRQVGEARSAWASAARCPARRRSRGRGPPTTPGRTSAWCIGLGSVWASGHRATQPGSRS